MLASERRVGSAAARPGTLRATGFSPTTSAADLRPRAACSRRVRWVRGLIQAAFAAFWIVRGSVVIGGGVAAALIAVFAVIVLGDFVYTVTATDGTAPRRRSAEGKRIERGVTIGPLLLWLDRRVSVPRYRSVGWALAIGPAIFVIALSGTALVATAGLGVGILFLGTGFAGFRDLARVRQVAQRVRAEEIVVLASVGAPA